MRINYNAPAMRANNSLNVADNRVAASLQKLSSGYKVNSAKDNPSGYAIGRRMNTQITGVGVATQNAKTGISIIETADGALTEVHEMLQRMNELAVKGETGTLTTADRMMVNQELQQLKNEIARIAKDTEFNGQTLLDGSFDLKGYTNNLDVKVGYYSDDVLEKVYTVDNLDIFFDQKGKIDLDRTKASFVPGNNFPSGVEVSSVGENCITLTNTEGFELTLDVAQDKAKVVDTANTSTTGMDASAKITIVSCSDEAYELGGGGFRSMKFPIGRDAQGDPEILALNYSSMDWPGLEDRDGSIAVADVEIINTAGAGGGTVYGLRITLDGGEVDEFEVVFDVTSDAINQTISDVVADGVTRDAVVVSENNNEQLDFELARDTVLSAPGLTIDVTGIGAMTTQIGANEGQVLDIRIPAISLQRLGITGAEVTTSEKSADANVAIKGAIAYVSDVRSRLGAYQNRLEHTVSSLDITNENMTASYSRIMDVDVSEEMTYYTSQQVVEQAAISMLAQANERPSQVLQLLQ
ncbi:MAG: hypothetical protein NC341_12405 [Blautia sp.]|nr:hypothetical protein [Blautia sp.]MCM1199907.1 hypothetical protein [Bacteroides fragilis]